MRLLTTLASSLSVALENARLFVDETCASARRSWPSSTASARPRAAQLDLDALIELVGDKMRRDLRADIVYIALLRPRQRA